MQRVAALLARRYPVSVFARLVAGVIEDPVKPTKRLRTFRSRPPKDVGESVVKGVWGWGRLQRALMNRACCSRCAANRVHIAARVRFWARQRVLAVSEHVVHAVIGLLTPIRVPPFWGRKQAPLGRWQMYTCIYRCDVGGELRTSTTLSAYTEQ